MKCEICRKDTKNHICLSSHIRQFHKMKVQEYYDKFLKKENEGVCLTCGKQTRFQSVKDGYNRFCSKQCPNKNEQVKEKIKQTCLEKYGVSYFFQSQEVKEKIKQTCLEKYGVDNSNKNEQVKEKIKQTCLEKYGVDHPSKTTEFQKKRVQTCLEKYGMDHPSKSQEVKDKKVQIYLKNFGVENPSQNYEVKEKVKRKRLENILPNIVKNLESLDLELDSEYNNDRELIDVKCKKCGSKFKTCHFNLLRKCGKCPICFPRGKGQQREVFQFVKSLSFKENILENCRSILVDDIDDLRQSKELDIYIPSLRIAIEFDGLYWHSEQFAGKMYHLNKTVICSNQGIKLIHIFEDEWINKQEIVKSRLKQILNKSEVPRIHARKCEIKEITLKEKNEFLDKFHLQGKDISKVRLGAFYKDELVSIMTFSHGSIAKGLKIRNSLVWELNRFCSNYNYHIPGIASKLLSYFKKNYKWSEIFSYADRRWSQGDLYYKLGFKLDHITDPNYWYIKGTNRIHRFNMRKRYNEPKDITEFELRRKEGYNRIWDCGNLKFRLEVSSK